MNVMTELINRINKLESPIVAGLDTTVEMIPDKTKDKYYAEYGETSKAV